ncbi:hypothetical protein K438DRAFT_1982300 [Mycena galopus ATCC 62051]|nr:hypothetical protein K438DRAFT_1982300 [Mycena galopus ATCC 62051]
MSARSRTPYAYVSPPSIDTQHGMQVIHECSGGIGNIAPLKSLPEPALYTTPGLPTCGTNAPWAVCFTHKTLPIIALAVLLALLVVVPILTYEYRKVREWMERRQRLGLVTSPPSVAIEMRVLDLRRVEWRAGRQEVEVEVYYGEWE